MSLRAKLKLPRIRVVSDDDTIDSTRAVVQEQMRTNPVLTFYMILISTLLLTGVGLIMVFSASSIGELSRQDNPFLAFFKPFTYAILGLLLMWLATKARPQLYFNPKVSATVLVAAIGFQLLVLPFGQNIGGNQNWIAIPGIGTVQPSEFLKVALIMHMAAIIGHRIVDLSDWASIGRYLAWPTLGSMAAIMVGGDFGTTLVVGSVVGAILFISGLHWKKIALLVLAALFGVAVASTSSSSRRARIRAFLPGAPKDEQGIDLQPLRAKLGLGTGGITGVGPGASRQKWNYLPQAESDFIYAILGEEFGLVGTLSVIILYMVLGWALLRLSRRARSNSIRIAAASTMAWIGLQALLNICVVVGISPVIGVPLPFISAGGSALVACLIAMGIMLSCARAEPGANEVLMAREAAIKQTIAVVGRRRKAKK